MAGGKSRQRLDEVSTGKHEGSPAGHWKTLKTERLPHEGVSTPMPPAITPCFQNALTRFATARMQAVADPASLMPGRVFPRRGRPLLFLSKTHPPPPGLPAYSIKHT